MRSVFAAATTSVGDAALRNCSIVGFVVVCGAAKGLAASTAPTKTAAVMTRRVRNMEILRMAVVSHSLCSEVAGLIGVSSDAENFGSALRLDEPEKRRSRGFVCRCSGWGPETQPSVAPFRDVFRTLAFGSLACR